MGHEVSRYPLHMKQHTGKKNREKKKRVKHFQKPPCISRIESLHISSCFKHHFNGTSTIYIFDQLRNFVSDLVRWVHAWTLTQIHISVISFWLVRQLLYTTGKSAPATWVTYNSSKAVGWQTLKGNIWFTTCTRTVVLSILAFVTVVKTVFPRRHTLISFVQWFRFIKATDFVWWWKSY